jgi:hypothetical protein
MYKHSSNSKRHDRRFDQPDEREDDAQQRRRVVCQSLGRLRQIRVGEGRVLKRIERCAGPRRAAETEGEAGRKASIQAST